MCCSVECSQASIWKASKAPDGGTSKLCAGCGVVKALDEFPNRTGAADGLQIRCRPCHAAFVAAWRRTKRQRDRAPEKRCPRCGETKPGTDFLRAPKTSDGCATYCKPCMSEWRRERNPIVAGSRLVTEKRCPTCKETKPAGEFFRNKNTTDGLYGYCKPCWTAYCKDHGSDPAQRAAHARAFHLRRNYGLTVEEYDAMLEAQCGVCVCGNVCATGKRLAVDHDHKTGEVRGLLCRRCNSILGYVDDDIALLVTLTEYLRRHGQS